MLWSIQIYNSIQNVTTWTMYGSQATRVCSLLSTFSSNLLSTWLLTMYDENTESFTTGQFASYLLNKTQEMVPFPCRVTGIGCCGWPTFIRDNPELCMKRMKRYLLWLLKTRILPSKWSKSCYDSAHICPIRGRNLNPRTLGKCFYFVICMISPHGFQTKLLPNKAQFWRFWGENVIFSLYNQPKTENIYKTLFPPRVPKHHLYQRCVSIKHTICVNGVLEHGGGTMFYRLKTK